MPITMPFNEQVNRLGGGELHRKLDRAESNGRKTVHLMTIQEGGKQELSTELLLNKAIIRLQEMISGRHGQTSGTFWMSGIGREEADDIVRFYIYAELKTEEGNRQETE